jgi:hypothetical protein
MKKSLSRADDHCCGNNSSCAERINSRIFLHPSPHLTRQFNFQLSLDTISLAFLFSIQNVQRILAIYYSIPNVLISSFTLFYFVFFLLLFRAHTNQLSFLIPHYLFIAVSAPESEKDGRFVSLSAAAATDKRQ